MTIKTVLYIMADTNDADYVTSEQEVSDEHLETIRKVCGLIAKQSKYFHNWPTLDQVRSETPIDIYPELTSEEIEIFDEYTPFAEYGIHTIEKVELREVKVLEKLI